MAAQRMRPQVMTPTPRSTIHEVTHRPMIRSTWLVVPGSAGRKPLSCSCVHPASTIMAASPIGTTAQRASRERRAGPCGWLVGTCDLSEDEAVVLLRVYNRTRRPPCGGRLVFDVFSRESMEGIAAGAAAFGVRVVDGEALLLDGVLEVDRGALEVRHAHLVDDDLDTVEVAGDVAVEQTLVEVELVDEARASAGLHGHAEAQVIASLLLEQGAHLQR